MKGVWFSPESICDLVIEIKENGEGEYYSTSSDKGCSGKNTIKGKVKYTNKKLYIGNTGFKFIAKPYAMGTGDSITAPVIGNVFTTKRYKAYATMTLKNNIFNSSQENTFIKFIEY